MSAQCPKCGRDLIHVTKSECPTCSRDEHIEDMEETLRDIVDFCSKGEKSRTSLRRLEAIKEIATKSLRR